MGRINIVSVTSALVLAAFVYGLVKYIPVYSEAARVDSVLSGIRVRSAKYSVEKLEHQEERLIEEATESIVFEGIDRETLQVYYSPNYDRILADYDAIVLHPWGEHRVRMRREMEIHP